MVFVYIKSNLKRIDVGIKLKKEKLFLYRFFRFYDVFYFFLVISEIRFMEIYLLKCIYEIFGI